MNGVGGACINFNPDLTASFVCHTQINPNSKAYNEGVIVGDYVEEINGQRTHGLPHNDAQQLIKHAGDTLTLELYRSVCLN